MPVAGKTVHVIRPKRRGAWCGLDVSPSGTGSREKRVRAREAQSRLPGGVCGVKDQVSRRNRLSYFMGVTKPCTKTKRWYAKTVALSSFSLQVNRNSMPKKDSRMSPPAARLAVRPVKPAVLPAVRARCTTPSALNAESPLRFLLSREKIVPCTAASALLPAADNQEGQLKPPKGGFSCFGRPAADFKYSRRTEFRPRDRGRRP